MNKTSTIYIAGHTGMVGSAILRRLKSEGYENIITRSHKELDLIEQQQVRNFFRKEKIDYVVLAAAKVGGIYANSTYRGEFIYDNLAIQNNVIHEAYRAGVQRLLFLGSSCIYPRLTPQPMKEDYLLTGPLEPTNEPYAIAKIAGIKLCEAYNHQYGTKYRSVMPTNLYGPNDSYDLENSHVMAALIRKFHLAKLSQNGDWQGILKDQSRYGTIPDDVMSNLDAICETAGYLPRQIQNNVERSEFDQGQVPSAFSLQPSVSRVKPLVLLWGTGTARREFLHVEDMADACVFLMKLPDETYQMGLQSEVPNSKSTSILGLSQDDNGHVPSFYNIGTGEDHTIKVFSEIVSKIVGFKGEIAFDPSRPDGVPQKQLDVSRLNRLGWKPKVPLSEGIRRTYEDYLR